MNNINTKERIEEDIKTSKEKNNKSVHKTEKDRYIKRKILICLKIILILFLLLILFIIIFFKTSLFQKYKELWVETAMSTMNHQYLATWFLSDEEINEILNRLKVENNEDSNSDNIVINKQEEKGQNITVEEISGKNYVGRVMIINDPTKVKLVDTRKSGTGTKLKDIIKKYDAEAGINAGGFYDPEGHGKGNILVDAFIYEKKMVSGIRNKRCKYIGLSEEGKLILGRYTYNEAISSGIYSAVEFGPYIIVNGKNQITKSNSGGLQPRSAIGQKKDGTMIFINIDGRRPGYSLGTTLMELQNIFNRYDAYNAANLDGGSSAVMYYNDNLMGRPSGAAGERYLPNAFIVEK